MEVRDDEEESSKPESYDDELVKIQRSALHNIVSRPFVLPIIYVFYWVASHVYS